MPDLFLAALEDADEDDVDDPEEDDEPDEEDEEVDVSDNVLWMVGSVVASSCSTCRLGDGSVWTSSEATSDSSRFGYGSVSTSSEATSDSSRFGYGTVSAPSWPSRRPGDCSVSTSSEAKVASAMGILADKALAIAISGVWTESVNLLIAIATSWRAATTDGSVLTDDACDIFVGFFALGRLESN